MFRLSSVLSLALVAVFLSCNSNNSQKNLIASQAIHEKDTSHYTLIAFPDSVQDFGNVKFGNKVKMTYHFKNVGDNPLYITNVEPSCGCTVADYTKAAVLPGKLGEITATFNSGHGAPGIVRKSIIVSSNTKNSPNYVLAFMGNVLK